MQEAARRHAAARSRLALAERTQRDEADALVRAHGGRTIGSGEALRGTRSAWRRPAAVRLGGGRRIDEGGGAQALVEGEPCPVCGSATHRQAEETAELVAALKLRKAAIDAQIEEAERLEAEAPTAAARSRQGVTEEQVATHRSEMVEARQAYGRSRALFLADRRQKDRDLAASADPDPVATESLIAMIDERRAACRERLKASSALRQRDQLVEAAEGFERELARSTEDRSALAGRLSELKEAAAVATERGRLARPHRLDRP